MTAPGPTVGGRCPRPNRTDRRRAARRRARVGVLAARWTAMLRNPRPRARHCQPRHSNASCGQRSPRRTRSGGRHRSATRVATIRATRLKTSPTDVTARRPPPHQIACRLANGAITLPKKPGPTTPRTGATRNRRHRAVPFTLAAVVFGHLQCAASSPTRGARHPARSREGRLRRPCREHVRPEARTTHPLLPVLGAHGEHRTCVARSACSPALEDAATREYRRVTRTPLRPAGTDVRS